MKLTEQRDDNNEAMGKQLGIVDVTSTADDDAMIMDTFKDRNHPFLVWLRKTFADKPLAAKHDDIIIEAAQRAVVDRIHKPWENQ